MLYGDFVKVTLHFYMGNVKPVLIENANEGKSYYVYWFVLEEKVAKRGSFVKAGCLCKEGCDGDCKHIAATMYALGDIIYQIRATKRAQSVCHVSEQRGQWSA